jgi:hypothetical protein
MTTKWLLDDGPFGLLAMVNPGNWNWPADALHVVEEVAVSAAKDKSGRRGKLLAMRDGNQPSITVHTIPAPSKAADYLFKYLRTRASMATRDMGEDASIAYCMAEDPDAVFVAMDKRAAYVALSELGSGRVVTPFDCWDGLLRGGLIARQDFDSLCDRALKGDSGLPGLPRRIADRIAIPP